MAWHLQEQIDCVSNTVNVPKGKPKVDHSGHEVTFLSFFMGEVQKWVIKLRQTTITAVLGIPAPKDPVAMLWHTRNNLIATLASILQYTPFFVRITDLSPEELAQVPMPGEVTL